MSMTMNSSFSISATPIQTTRRTERRLGPFTVLRELLTTVALCYLITLALLRLIALYLDFFLLALPSSCDGTRSYRTYQHAVQNIPQFDIMKITTIASVVAFAALELCVLLARRAGCECEMAAAGDVEYAYGNADLEFEGESEKAKAASAYEYIIPTEKQYFEIAP
ncbi:hypothetical protein R3P38DRAFT_1849018 [Favolaschia claudopus]|uniref:Uncharacterized protein n=1 Tax=Favolaschia claudopus TaxID=2862362 RepID=A0AAW0D9F7_9AGAR